MGKQERMAILKTKYTTYHWLTKRHKDEVCTVHPTYAIAKKNAEYWEERGYHVIVRVPAEHKMYTEG